MFYPDQSFRDEGNVGIRAFGGRSANGLIRATIAGVTLAGLFGFGARTMFCIELLVSSMASREIERRTRFRRNEIWFLLQRSLQGLR